MNDLNWEYVAESHKKLGFNLDIKLYYSLMEQGDNITNKLRELGNKRSLEVSPIKIISNEKVCVAIRYCFNTFDRGDIPCLCEQDIFPFLELQLLHHPDVRRLLHREKIGLEALGTGNYVIDLDTHEFSGQYMRKYIKASKEYHMEDSITDGESQLEELEKEDLLYHLKYSWELEEDKIPLYKDHLSLIKPFYKSLMNHKILEIWSDKMLQAVVVLDTYKDQAYWLFTMQRRDEKSKDLALGNFALIETIKYCKDKYKTLNLGLDIEPHKLRFKPNHIFNIGLKDL